MSQAQAERADEAAPPAQQQPHRPLLTPLTGLVALLLVIGFAPYLTWMWDIWMRSEYYGHGPLIPIISAYLVYSRRREFVQAEGGYNLWGLPAVALGLLLHAAAIYLDVNFPQGFAMIITIAGLIVLLFGWGRAKVIAFPVAYLVFMVPTGRLLVTQFSNPLQIGATSVASGVVGGLGIPVQVEGTTIAIPEYTFEVAQACSGLKSTIAMSALAALFAYLVVAPAWKRVVLFVAGAPVALAANAVRITFTVFLGRAFGEGAAEGFFHTVSGMLVFLLGLMGLFGVARLLRCDHMREDIW